MDKAIVVVCRDFLTPVLELLSLWVLLIRSFILQRWC